MGAARALQELPGAGMSRAGGGTELLCETPAPGGIGFPLEFFSQQKFGGDLWGLGRVHPHFPTHHNTGQQHPPPHPSGPSPKSSVPSQRHFHPPPKELFFHPPKKRAQCCQVMGRAMGSNEDPPISPCQPPPMPLPQSQGPHPLPVQPLPRLILKVFGCFSPFLSRAEIKGSWCLNTCWLKI